MINISLLPNTAEIFVPNASGRLNGILFGIGAFLFGVFIFIKIISTIISSKDVLKKINILSLIVLTLAINFLAAAIVIAIDGGIGIGILE